MLKTSRALMIQGTTSDAGKSVLTAGLGRVLARKGIKVAPFKSQNMALNSAVTLDGGEIGRAQAVQAFACGVEPSVDMNPVLLKPNSDTGAQVIVQGQVCDEMNARGYHEYKAVVMPKVMESFNRLLEQYQSIVIEGAGSPAEINLRDNDIANMGFAEEADIPVIIVADIDKGGVFAHLYGTLALLSESEQARVVGFVINRFRGDISLLESGLDWLEQKTGKPVLGVLPYLHGLMLEAEDAINTEQNSSANAFRVVVPVLPRVSNHTDFDPLRMHPDIELVFAIKGQPFPNGDLIVLSGSKSVRADLAFLKAQGWDKAIARHLRLGGKVMGICGGYQMLGEHIFDPLGIEGEPGSAKGLGYLPMDTELKPQKQLHRIAGWLSLGSSKKVRVTGYEIHAGISTCASGINAPIVIEEADGELRTDGLLVSVNDDEVSADSQIFGTYLHGIFEQTEALTAILNWAGMDEVQPVDFEQLKEQSIERLADAIENHMDLQTLWPDLNMDNTFQPDYCNS